MKTIIDELENHVDRFGFINYSSLSTEQIIRLLTYMYNQGYKAGHYDTVESQYVDIDYRDMETYNENEVHYILAES